MSKVLVTGASGFIGKALVARLRKHPVEVVGLSSSDGDIAEPDTLHNLAGGSFSHIFHLAARTFVPDSWNFPHAFYQTNVLGTVNVLEFCKTNGVPLTYLSAYLYGHPESLPVKEDSPVRPNNPYALSKYLGEQLCSFYSNAHCQPITVIRPFNVYGVGQNERFLIPAVVKQALFDDTITVKDLRPRRDYIYLDDLVEALVLTMKSPPGYRVYNIGSGASSSVREIIDIVQSAAHTSKKIVCDDLRRPNEINDVIADISRAQENLGWQPRHSFPAGIRKIVQVALGEKYE